MLRQIVGDPVDFLTLRWQALVSGLFYPDRFYEEHSRSYGLKWEVLVLLCIGALGSVGFYYGVQTILGEFTLGAETAISTGDKPGMADKTARQLRARVAYPVIGILLIWGYYTTSYYAGAWLFSGHGTYFDTLKNTAWALLPFTFANLFVTIALFLTYSGLELETQLPGLPEENVAYLLGQGYTELPMVVLPLVKIAVVAWVAYIGASALSDAMQIPRERAIQIAAAPAIVHAAYLLWQAFGRLGIA